MEKKKLERSVLEKDIRRKEITRSITNLEKVLNGLEV